MGEPDDVGRLTLDTGAMDDRLATDPMLLSAYTVAEQSGALEVVDRTSAENASACIAILKRGLRTLDDLHERWVRPLGEAKKLVMGKLARRREPLDAVCDALCDRLILWQESVETLASIERNRLVAENEAIAETGPAEQTYVPGAPRTFDTPAGTVITSHRWTHVIVDAERVPREYCTPDAKLINDAIRNGVKSIPGVRIFSKAFISSRADRSIDTGGE